MSRGEDGTERRRRGFLRTLGGLATAGTAAAAAGPAAAQRASRVPADQARKENEQQRLAARYRETEHVKAFYRTNRYEY
jgi:hypothetical protein